MSATPANPTLERLADAVAARLLPRLTSELAVLIERHDRSAGPALVDASELAAILNVSRDWVYAHAAELGALRLGENGDGQKPRLRFDVDAARRALAGGTETERAPSTAVVQPPSRPHTGELLPIRGPR